jgi:PHP family Zn ribbon phosphoesterase
VTICPADLHVHTALSPCADDGMTPPAIVEGALREGLAMIAVCDHNSARNAAAVQLAAGRRLVVLAGMEITSVEECHVVGLFPDARAAEAAGARVAALLPEAEEGYAQFFGEQSVLDARGELLDRETRALATATPLDLAACVELVHRHGGLAIAAHVDRPSFGVIGQLGVFPDEAGFDAVEVSRHVPPGTPDEQTYAAIGLSLLRSSDAHFLADIGAARTSLDVAHASFSSVAAALRAGASRRGTHA